MSNLVESRPENNVGFTEELQVTLRTERSVHVCQLRHVFLQGDRGW